MQHSKSQVSENLVDYLIRHAYVPSPVSALNLETQLAQACRVCELWCCEVQSHSNLSDRGHKVLALL